MLNFKLADRVKQIINHKNQQLLLKNKETKLLEAKIAEKDNRNAQLHELFKGTANIFNKQHNYVDKLKEELKKEQQEKGISEEKQKHLQEDIKRLDQEKEELNNRIKELESADGESKKVRDEELKDLKEKIKTLTTVKMERERSEERLRKQNEDFANMMAVHEQVYEILGKYSDKTGLLLRSQEVIEKLKELSGGDKKKIEELAEN